MLPWPRVATRGLTIILTPVVAHGRGHRPPTLPGGPEYAPWFHLQPIGTQGACHMSAHEHVSDSIGQLSVGDWSGVYLSACKVLVIGQVLADERVGDLASAPKLRKVYKGKSQQRQGSVTEDLGRGLIRPAPLRPPPTIAVPTTTKDQD